MLNRGVRFRPERSTALGRAPVAPMRRAPRVVLVALLLALGGGVSARAYAAGSQSVFAVSTLPVRPTALVEVSNRVALLAGEDGSLWRSTDGGRSWTALLAHCAPSAVQAMPCGIDTFAVLRTGTVLAAGQSPARQVWLSADAGRHWRPVPLPQAVWAGPWSAGAEALLLVSPAGPPPANLELLVTRDGGRQWQRAGVIPGTDPDHAAPGPFNGLTVLGPSTWVASYRLFDCLTPPHLRLTTDGGRTWQRLGLHTLLVPGANALAAAGPHTLVLGAAFNSCPGAPSVGQGIVLHAMAGIGRTPWQAAILPAGDLELTGVPLASSLRANAPHAFPPDASVRVLSVDALAFPGSSDGIAVGGQARAQTDGHGALPPRPLDFTSLILLTRDGGHHWSDASIPRLPELQLLSCADTEHCLMASYSGVAVRYAPHAASAASAPGSKSEATVASTAAVRAACAHLHPGKPGFLQLLDLVFVVPPTTPAASPVVLAACGVQGSTFSPAVDGGTVSFAVRREEWQSAVGAPVPVGQPSPVGACTFRRGACGVVWRPSTGWWEVGVSFSLPGGASGASGTNVHATR